MSKEDLIPVTMRSKEEAFAIRSKGGRTKSPLKKYAAKIREMKKRGLTNPDIAWFVARLEDPDVNIFHLQKWLDELKDNIHPSQRVALLNTGIALHKAKHGEKIKSESVVHIVNWTETLKGDEVSDKAKEFKEKDTIDV